LDKVRQEQFARDFEMIFYKATAEVYRRYTRGGGFVKKRPKDEQGAYGKNTGRKKITASCLEYLTLAVTVVVWRTSLQILKLRPVFFTLTTRSASSLGFLPLAVIFALG